jgi:hypothetical protein
MHHYYTLRKTGSTQILEYSKYPISLRGELAVNEAILILRYSDFNSSHKQINFDDHTLSSNVSTQILKCSSFEG